MSHVVLPIGGGQFLIFDDTHKIIFPDGSLLSEYFKIANHTKAVHDALGITAANHAASHTDGSDDVQSATNAQKGVATASHITAIEANTSKNSYPSADAIKVGFIAITQNVDLDVIKTNVAANNAKVTNATHTGEVTGGGELTITQAAIIPAKMKTKSVVDLADTASTFTATQIVDSGIFTATPTADRIQTTDTAVNIIASLPGYQVGTWCDFTLVNTAAFNETVAAGAGVTLIGNMILNNNSGTFKCLVTSSTTISIYRTN